MQLESVPQAGDRKLLSWTQKRVDILGAAAAGPFPAHPDAVVRALTDRSAQRVLPLDAGRQEQIDVRSGFPGRQ